jgi:prepilin-type N-terminal cleavage/methylation domain-containing protein
MKTPSAMFNDVMKKKNKKNRKGFSLVELIVVLVIMAILAAALVPTLIGYIKQSRQSNVKNEAASCVQAAQTIVSSAYADTASTYAGQGTDNKVVFTFGTTVTWDNETKFYNEILYLADLTGSDGKADTTNYSIDSVTINATTLVVEELEYTNVKKKTTVTYSGGTYTAESTSASTTAATEA